MEAFGSTIGSTRSPSDSTVGDHYTTAAPSDLLAAEIMQVRGRTVALLSLLPACVYLFRCLLCAGANFQRTLGLNPAEYPRHIQTLIPTRGLSCYLALALTLALHDYAFCRS